MKFTPKSDKELSEMNLLPPGKYSFEILDALEKTSKAGAPMIALNIQLFNSQLEPCGRVYDYLLEAMPHKLKHAAYACALGNSYETGMLEASYFLKATGELMLIIQKDKNNAFPDKNSVHDYIIVNADGTPKLQKSADQYANQSEPKFTEDDLPF